MLISSSKYGSKFILGSAGKTTLSSDVVKVIIYVACRCTSHKKGIHNEINGTNVRKLSTFNINTFTIYSHTSVKSQPLTKKRAFCTRLTRIQFF